MATSILSLHVNTLHANERVSPTDLSEMSMSVIGSMKTSAGGEKMGDRAIIIMMMKERRVEGERERKREHTVSNCQQGLKRAVNGSTTDFTFIACWSTGRATAGREGQGATHFISISHRLKVKRKTDAARYTSTSVASSPSSCMHSACNIHGKAKG